MMTHQVQTKSQESDTKDRELAPQELEQVNAGSGAPTVVSGGLYRMYGDYSGDGTVDAADYVIWR